MKTILFFLGLERWGGWGVTFWFFWVWLYEDVARKVFNLTTSR